MLGEDVDKFLVRELHKNTPFFSCILCQVLDAINSDPRKTMLGNWWSSYVSSVVIQPIRLCTHPTDKDIPIASMLGLQQSLELAP
jgi:hypothetical protein